MFGRKFLLTTLSLISALCCALSYGVPASVAVYTANPVAYNYASRPVNVAAAKASASTIQNVNWSAWGHYGHEIGRPLLVQSYGPLTSLYSALAPKRSFVGTIDSGFYKDHYGNVKFHDGTAVGALAI